MDKNLNAFYEAAPFGLCIVEKDGDRLPVQYCNPHFIQLIKRWLGEDEITPADITGHTLADLLPDYHDTDLTERLNSSHPPYNYTITLEKENAAGIVKRWIKLFIQECNYRGAEAFVLWFTDISEDKYAEALLEEALAEADQISELKTNFLATVSHEIRTPMQSVFGLLELIGADSQDDNIKSMVHTARESASAMMSILDDILDLTKMDADKMELDEFEVPLRTLVHGVIEAIKAQPKSKHITFVDEIDPAVPRVIEGDPLRLRQILMNLISNAVKFTEDGTVAVTLKTATLHTSDDPVPAIRFEVQDSGPGISKAAQDKLFSPFTQADNSITRKFGGTGLGLSICHKLVTLMGGQIGIESDIGNGATFWFEIPAHEISTDAAQSDLPNLDGVTVLSVEDHPQGAKEIKYALETMGAKVTVCGTYTEALTITQEQPFDITIVDQGLPDGLGTDLITDILDIRPSSSILMYTVREDPGMHDALTSMGVSYLSKPASRLGLADAIVNSLQRNIDNTAAKTADILIAEDTESVRHILAKQFDQFDINITFAQNGEDALQKLTENDYDMLITDLHMPVMDGYELVAAARNHDNRHIKSMPIVALTADIQTSRRNIYLEHRFDECLIKPVSLGQIKRLLIRWNLFRIKNTANTTDESAAADIHANDAPITARPVQAIDKNKIKEHFGQINAESLGMIGIFLDMSSKTIEKLTDAATHNDTKAVHDLSHSLKGAAYSACCIPLGNIAKQIQDMAHQDKADYNDLIKQIPYEIENIRDDLKKLKTTYATE